MMEIKFQEYLDEAQSDFLGEGFERYAAKNGVICDYKSFSFIAQEDGAILGALTGHCYYGEAHVADLIVAEERRFQGVGAGLLRAAEDYCRAEGVSLITLNTYEFQAPEFYQKYGYKIEYVRENRREPKLTKYYLIKYL